MTQAVGLEAGVASAASPETLQDHRSLIVRLVRRALPLATVLVTVLILRAWKDRTAATLGHEAFATGYSLLSICVLLMLLGLRKRIHGISLGRLAFWQRTHHYLGLLSLAAYVLHAGLITTGWLESILAILFWIIGLSGIGIWYINRVSPRMLRAAGPVLLRHDIPRRRREIREASLRIALVAAGKSDTAALADHYSSVLSPFFMSGRSLLYKIRPQGTRRRRLMTDLENVDRYLSADGIGLRHQMSQLVQAKDDVDFQSAIQNRVRLCAAMHVWLLGAFFVLTMAHVLIAHRFVSGW